MKRFFPLIFIVFHNNDNLTHHNSHFWTVAINADWRGIRLSFTGAIHTIEMEGNILLLFLCNYYPQSFLERTNVISSNCLTYLHTCSPLQDCDFISAIWVFKFNANVTGTASFHSRVWDHQQHWLLLSPVTFNIMRVTLSCAEMCFIRTTSKCPCKISKGHQNF